jgi:hypothetical protein
MHVLLGVASMIVGVWILLAFGAERRVVPTLQIRFGLYVTLLFGVLMAYGGVARFVFRSEKAA